MTFVSSSFGTTVVCPIRHLGSRYRILYEFRDSETISTLSPVATSVALPTEAKVTVALRDLRTEITDFSYLSESLC